MNETDKTLIQNESFFDIFSRTLYRNVIKGDILDEEALVTTIKATILDNQDLFLGSLITELDYKILKLKKKAQLLFKDKNKKREYVEIGYKLSELNDKKKQLNIAREKAKREEGTKSSKLWHYLIENHSSIAEDFKIKYKAGKL